LSGEKGYIFSSKINYGLLSPDKGREFKREVKNQRIKNYFMKQELFTIEEIYDAYKDCIKNKKSSKDYLEYELKHQKRDLVKLLEEINTKIYKV
jgi:hypothetical protein